MHVQSHSIKDCCKHHEHGLHDPTAEHPWSMRHKERHQNYQAASLMLQQCCIMQGWPGSIGVLHGLDSEQQGS